MTSNMITSNKNVDDADAVVHKVTSLEERSTLAHRLANLSKTTEMKAYGVEQWQYLLDAGVNNNTNNNNLKQQHVVTPFLVTFSSQNTQSAFEAPILGCLLRMDYHGTDPNHQASAYGMMLVSPEARGRGLARKLVAAAMTMAESDPTSTGNRQSKQSTTKQDPLHILAVCGEMGVPLYQKMKFQRVGTVTKLTASIESINNNMRRNQDQEHSDKQGNIHNKNDNNNVKVTITQQASSPMWSKILALDAQATGLDRSATLNAIQQYDYVQTATVTTKLQKSQPRQNAEEEEETLLLAALLTRHTTNPGLVTVGPLLGDANYVPTLLRAIVEEVSNDNGNVDNDNANENTAPLEISLTVSEHFQLVQRLRNDVGFDTVFELGTMTLGGRPLPGERDLYLGLLHPTLG